jgi:hypothetical protein
MFVASIAVSYFNHAAAMGVWLMIPVAMALLARHHHLRGTVDQQGAS